MISYLITSITSESSKNLNVSCFSFISQRFRIQSAFRSSLYYSESKVCTMKYANMVFAMLVDNLRNLWITCCHPKGAVLCCTHFWPLQPSIVYCTFWKDQPKKVGVGVCGICSTVMMKMSWHCVEGPHEKGFMLKSWRIIEVTTP